MSDPLAEADPSRDSEPSRDASFDNYRSLANPNVRIIVAKDVVRTRFSYKGPHCPKSFFLFRVNEDGTGGSELIDFPSTSPAGSVE
jgi:hypothetical protein